MQAIQTQQTRSVKAYLEAQEERVRKLLEGSSHLQPKPLINKFLFALYQNEKLRSCSQTSLLNALLFCAEKKLAPVNGKIVLVPYGDKCEALVGVPGIRELIRRNPDVKRVGGDVVRRKDDFKLVSGMNPTIHHIPNVEEDSDIMGAYAYAELSEGSYLIRYCNQQEIEASKTASKGSSSPHSPWNKFFPEMARLVPLRKLAKELITDEVAPTFDTLYEEEIKAHKPPLRVVSSAEEDRIYETRSDRIASMIPDEEDSDGA